MLLSVGGATAVAAMSVVMYVESLVASMLFGMVDSVQPAISYCNGAGLAILVPSMGWSMPYAAVFRCC